MRQRASGRLNVGDLMTMKHLQLGLLGGEAGTDRTIAATHVSELEEPALWLNGGELLMANGLGLPADPEGQTRYLRSLSDCGAAALALGVRTPDLTDEMLRLSDELAFPVLRVPREIPFLAVARAVSEANQREEHQRLVTQIRLFQTLQLRTAVDADPQHLFTELERLSGYRLGVVSAANRTRLFGRTPDELGTQLPDPWPEDPQFMIPGGFCVAIPVRHRLAAFLVGIEADDMEPAGLAALQQIATIAALEVTDLCARRDDRRRDGAALLAELVEGRLAGPDADQRLIDFGVPACSPLRVVHATLSPGLTADALHDRLTDAGGVHLVLERDGAVTLLLTTHDSVDVLEASDVRGGLSLPFDGGAGIPTARRQAQWAASSARDGADSGLVSFDVADSVASWFPSDPHELRRLAQRELGPIIDYDREHGTELLESMRRYLFSDKRLSATADDLCIHKHTLVYRLKRVESLTGRDLSRTQDSAELWLALRALALVEDSPGY